MIQSELPKRTKPAEDLIGYDRGDLLTDLDRQIGDVIERAVNRYHDRELARQLRKTTVEDLGDKIITFDRVLKEAKA